ncbi:MAG TPA: helix-turn-helix domain-containing protein, partial [Chloroflexota bacterium]|nr:helix-turn-helix domain-containing protein [Chloroflexota bacterium]
TALQKLMHGYTQALLHQLARTAGCNRVHSVDQRCARLILMTADRVGRDSFAITHETLAATLAVRRASVTEAAGTFHRAGLIDYRRGHMTLCDRAGLEALACEDYRLMRVAYDRLYASSQVSRFS